MQESSEGKVKRPWPRKPVFSCIIFHQLAEIWNSQIVGRCSACFTSRIPRQDVSWIQLCMYLADNLFSFFRCLTCQYISGLYTHSSTDRRKKKLNLVSFLLSWGNSYYSHGHLHLDQEGFSSQVDFSTIGSSSVLLITAVGRTCDI